MTVQRSKCCAAHVAAVVALQLIGMVAMPLSFPSVNVSTFQVAINLHTAASVASFGINTVTVLVEFFCNFSKYRRMLRLLQEYKGQQTDLGLSVKSSIGFGWKIAPFVSTIVVLLMFMNILSFQDKIYSFVIMSAQFVNACVTTMNMYKFYFLLLFIRSKMCDLKRCVSEMDVAHPSRIFPTNLALSHFGTNDENGQLDSCCQQVRCARLAFETLCELAKEVWRAHQLFLALQVPLMLLRSTAYMYITVASLAAGWAPFLDAHHLQLWLALLHELATLLTVLVPAHVAAREALGTADVASRLLLQAPPGGCLERELLLFLRQVERRAPKFSVYGIVQLDLKFLAAFVSVLTTYTVILHSVK
ncbi:uncharacterized protein LOC126163245 [Schistocerca cancellata]|uniref:uncharacterized protein LOC126163245 n=1 Tax=Schistocerca cancellata TaxID=274614 RepID=UPI00211765AD|nr:uncharacterized protein LOC126163245 [Schistocerca cancellata]